MDLAWLLSAGVAAGLLVAPGADLQELKTRGVLKAIAHRSEYPEMFSFDTGGTPGFEREVIESFARIHNLKLEAVAVAGPTDRIPALQRGLGDVITGIIRTPERESQVDFTVELYVARHLAVTHDPHPTVASVEELRKQPVGIVKGTSWERAAIEAGVPADKLVSFLDRHQMLAALRAGKIPVAVMSSSDFAVVARQEPRLKGGVAVGSESSTAFAVRKGDDQLLAALNEYLTEFRRSPSWNKLVFKYFGENALSVLGRARK
jgi:ABC-type amino acid transport substrate-binding protein